MNLLLTWLIEWNTCSSIGQLSLLFTYVGEFQTTTLRKRILSFMDAALIVGMIIVPRKYFEQNFTNGCFFNFILSLIL